MNKEGGTLQNITTLLAYALPLLQFFFALLPASIVNFFTFNDYFMVVSIFTAVLSYILILVFRATPYFSWLPFQKKRKQSNEKWRIYTDRAVHTIQDIRKYQKENDPPKPLKVINSDNIVIKLLVPLIASSFLVFCAVGAAFLVASAHIKSQQNIYVLLQLLQALAYSTFLVSSVLAFANQFLRETGLARYRKNNSEKFKKAIEIVRERNGFNELKSIRLIRQFQKTDPNDIIYSIFFLGVDKEFYVIVADVDIDMVYTINRFTTQTEAETFISS